MTGYEVQQFSPLNWNYHTGSQLKDHSYALQERFFSQGEAQRDRIQNLEQLRDRQRFVREKFLEGLGGLPSFDGPLQPQITGTELFDGYRVEKVIFQSRPGVYVTNALYLPEEVSGPGSAPTGAVLFLHGHTPTAKMSALYQTVCQYLVRAGLVVLAMDPPGQGERYSYYVPSLGKEGVNPSVAEHEYTGERCFAAGDSLARYFLHDAMRAVDYLCTRREVDPSRIGATGCSGGGTQTSMLMMADPRIAAAAPATFIMNRREYMYSGAAQDSEQIWPWFTANGLDHEDILLSMAPRPVDVLAVKYDFFPIEGARSSVERCMRMWELAGNPGGLKLFEDASVHTYTPRLAMEAGSFFARHLLGRKLDAAFWERQIPKIHPVPEQQLWCTSKGQVMAQFEDALPPWKENALRCQELSAANRELPAGQRRQLATEWLRERIYYNRQPSPVNCRLIHTNHCNDLRVDFALWWSQPRLMNYGVLFRRAGASGPLPAVVALWQDGTKAIARKMDWILDRCYEGRAVLVLDLSGMGNIAPDQTTSMEPHSCYGVFNRICDDLIWCGDSLAALRGYDVCRAVEMLRELEGIDGGDVSLYAEGYEGIPGLYAALAAGLFSKVETKDVCPGGFAKAVSRPFYNNYDFLPGLIPGLLRYLDIPEMEEWIN